MTTDHSYDTRPEVPAHTSGNSPTIGKASYQMHIEVNIWLLLFSLLVLTPLGIYLGLLALTMTGLVTP